MNNSSYNRSGMSGMGRNMSSVGASLLPTNRRVHASQSTLPNLLSSSSSSSSSSSAYSRQSNLMGASSMGRSSVSESTAYEHEVTREQHRGGVYLTGLNTYQVGWIVTARVFTKSDIRTYSNERGSGKIGSIVLVDESGSMKAVFFSELVDKWWPVLLEGGLYRISQARISPSRDSQYGSATSSEYDMIITSETQFQELPDDPSIPYHSLRLQPLAELTKILASQQEQQGRMYHQHMQQQSNLTIPVDVIGIITEYGPQISTMSKRQQQLVKRDLTIMDQSGAAVKITIWGEKFQLDESQLQPPSGKNCNIIAVSGARVSEFAGCSLSTSFSSSVFVNPDWKEVQLLRQWFAQQGVQAIQSGKTTMLSTAKSGDSLFFQLDQYPLSDIQLMNQLKSQWTSQPIMQPVTLKVQARITFIRQDPNKPPWYVACPNEGCRNKKVQSSDGDTFWCEKCSNITSTPNYCYLLSFIIQDETGSSWLSCFDREGEKILGLPAKGLQQLLIENADEYKQVFARAANTDWIFGIKSGGKSDAQSSQYDSTPRFQAFTVHPLDYAQDIRQIEQFIHKIEQHDTINAHM